MGIARLWRRFTALFHDTDNGTSSGVERQPMDRHYVSEFTAFMNRYLEEHPEVVADQARGRAIYWDKKVNFEELKKEAEEEAPPEAYPYFKFVPDQPPRDK